MCGSSLAAYELRPRKMLADQLGILELDSAVPKILEGWVEDASSGVALVNPQTQELLDSLYSDILSRTYINPQGKRVMLSLAYGINQSDDKAVHYPDVCYPAQGFRISNKREVVLSLQNHKVNALTLLASLPGRSEPVTYWAVVGDQVVKGPLNHKSVQLRYGFQGFIPDGMIFRVSTIGDSEDLEYKVQEQFLNALYGGISPRLRPRFFGA